MSLPATESVGKIPVFDAPADGHLRADMVRAYREAGVMVLRNFVSLAACKRLRKRAGDLVRDFDPDKVKSVFSTTKQSQLTDRYFIDSGDKIRFFLEANAFDESGKLRQSKENSLNKMGHAMHDIDPVFDEFSHSAELDRIAKALGIADPVVIQSMYLFKPPRIGAEVVCHQDSTYIYTEPESCIGFWFALEDATTENGCMYFIPGGHRGPLRLRNHRLEDGSLRTDVMSDEPFDEERKVAAEVSAGSLVVFDGRAPHMSGENRSPKSRHAYSLHVIDRRCHYPADNWLQRGPELPLRGLA
ncbi:MAG TPA: phytanoyl-CoA dioxygenase family protein [Woeseiaceae bacterium]|nr:phytanoyl-CoA dioxygenase family protein [Woeseiaceae bacterium]